MSKRYMLKVQGSNTTPTKVMINGFSVTGAPFSEIVDIPVLADNEVYQYCTVNSYDLITPLYSEDFLKAKVTLEAVETPTYNTWELMDMMGPLDRTVESRKSTLAEQDKAALKAMIREVVTEVVNEALDERERNADEARRREYMEI